MSERQAHAGHPSCSGVQCAQVSQPGPTSQPFGAYASYWTLHCNSVLALSFVLCFPGAHFSAIAVHLRPSLASTHIPACNAVASVKAEAVEFEFTSKKTPQAACQYRLADQYCQLATVCVTLHLWLSISETPHHTH